MEAARTSETSVGTYFITRQYIPEDKSELHTRRHENLKSHRTCIDANEEKKVVALKYHSLRNELRSLDFGNWLVLS
jgi:hypothetical protein